MQEHRQRLDKWLCFARFARTRPAAVRLVEDGHVRVAGRRAGNPAQGLKPHATVVVRVVAFAERRGPFATARLLYERLDDGGDDPSLAADADHD